MSEMYSQSEAYFATLNPLSRKVFKDLENFKKTFGNDWNDFPLDKQEELLDKFIVDPRLAEKYQSDSRSGIKEPPVVFPKYKIACGEKVVVDFENEEDWNTHCDEHSGPFSWRTRSQQDLTLEDDNTTPPEDKKNRSKRSRSPERVEISGSEKSDRNPWDSPFLNAEKQKTDTKDEIFRKFGISFGTDDETVPGADERHPDALTQDLDTEESSLLPSGDELGTDNCVFEDIEADSPSIVPSSDSSADIWKGAGTPSYDLGLNSVKDQRDFTENDTLFVLDLGESSTDPDEPRRSIAVTEQPVAVTDSIQPTLSDWDTQLQSQEDSTNMSKSGFDFLDDW